MYFGDQQVGYTNRGTFNHHPDYSLDDAMAPGFRLKIPMMIVLDTLRSDDPNLRRVGETWMRCSLKSYLR